MYTWIWRRLPGPFATRALVSAVLLLTTLVILWVWIFPWVYAHVPL